MTTVTIGDVLPLAPADERLPDPVRGLLVETWGERGAGEVAALTVFGIARELLAVMSDGDGYSNDDRFGAAEALHELLRRGGFAAESASAPVKVTLDIPKSLAEMPLRDLLALLVAEPERSGEVRPHVGGNPQVRAAQSRTSGAWVIPGDSGGIDVEATLAYLGQVSRPHASAQRVFRGRRPVTLAAALGLDERALIHPFTGHPVQGPDANGFDFSELPAELHEALLWAALTGNPAWPAQIDLYTYTEEVFADRLPRRWQRILDDYRAAKAAEEPSTRVTRYWPEGIPMEGIIDLASGLPGTGTRQAGRAAPVDYRALVMEAASARGSLRASGVGTRYAGSAYTSISASGVDVSFSDVVATGEVRVSGVGVRGTVLLLPGACVRDSGVSNTLVGIDITWQQAAERLGVA